MPKAKTKPQAEQQELPLAVAEDHAVEAFDPELLARLTRGAGTEEAVGREVFAIPFLTVLQPLSPQLNPSAAEYIDTARPGMIYNTVTQALAKSVTVIPVKFSRTFLEWVPRVAGGGFRGEHTDKDAALLFNKYLNRETGRAVLPNGNELVDSRNHYVLILNEDGSTSPAVVCMSSTQTRVSSRWNSLIGDFRPTLVKLGVGDRVSACAAMYELSTAHMENKKGKWYGWNVKRTSETPLALQAQAIRFLTQIESGRHTVDRSATIEPEQDDL